MELTRSKTRSSSPTLVTVVREESRTRGARPLYTFLRDGESANAGLTYGELDARARATAALLQRRDLAGERVLLLFPPGLDFIVALFGCFYAGSVAVPCYPPGRRGRTAFASIVRDAAPRAVLSSADLARRAEDLRAGNEALATSSWLTLDAPDEPSDWDDSTAPGPEDLALLQYTSGSTAEPKGVMVSHGNLAHNQEVIRRAFGTDERSVIVTWLPLYHDMGLIGGVLHPLFVGASCVLMSPVAFLQRPRRWLDAISRFRATVSGGPNFAYDLCVRRIGPEERETLDLSSWQVAFNGSEPVRPDTLDRFSTAFRDAGFERRAFYPCYGLAEATLFVTGGDRTAGPELAPADDQAPPRPGDGAPPRARVSCGRAWRGQRVEVVDPESRRRCPEGSVGEIWVSGPSVALGYWQREEQTSETFRARLAEEGEQRVSFLRTGDLGFLRGGRLFVTGRLKDLVIIRGRNHYPQDIELTVESSRRELRSGCCAAFSVEAGGEERLVVVQELAAASAGSLPADEIASDVREAVASEHEVPVWALVLVAPGSVPKTTSGKVRRAATRQMYLHRELPVLAESVLDGLSGDGVDEPAEAAGGLGLETLRSLPEPDRAPAVEAHLAVVVGRLLGVAASRLPPGRSLSASGLDSLAALELAGAIEEDFGVAIDLRRLLSGQTLRELAEIVRERAGTSEPRAAPAVPARVAEAGQDAPATRGQHGLWFLQRLDPTSVAYNVPVAAWVAKPLDLSAFERALERLVDRHAALRTTFVESADGRLIQRVRPRSTLDFEVVRESDLGGEERSGWMARVAFRPFDLESGPLLRIRVLEQADRCLIVLAVHHIVSDFWSLAVLGRELAAAYRAETTGEAVALGPVARTLRDVAVQEEERLSGEEGERLREYWEGKLSGELPVLDLPLDRPRPAVFDFRGRSCIRRLGGETRGDLRRLARRHDTTLFTTLLAAFQALLVRYTGEADLLVGVPVHLRASPRLARVVGYLVNPVVLRLDAGGRPTFEAFLGRVRETALEAFAHRELPFAELAQRLQPDRDASRSPVFQVMFGLQQAPPGFPPTLAAFALGRGGPVVDLGGLVLEAAPLEQRTAQFDLELMAADTGEEIGLSLIYATSLFEASTAERLLGHLARLAAAAAAEPGRRLDELDLLAPAERQQALLEWQGPRVPLPPASLLDLFAERAERTPDAVAGRCADRALSYGELAVRVRRLGSALAARRLQPEAPVAVLADRSLELLTAFLGILQAGAAYFPLDPRSPDLRLRALLADSRSPLLLADEKHRERAERILAEDRAGSRPVLAGPVEELARRGDGAGTGRTPPGRLAYVLYTSGSTGRPKGAMVEASGMLNHLHAKLRDLRLRADDVVAQSASQAFDVSIWQLAAPLLAGGCVDVLPDEVAFAPDRLFDAVTARRISVLEVVPSLLASMLDGVDAVPAERRPAALRWLVPTGEALPPELCRSWLELFPGVPVVNAYGPTECSDDVTHHRVAASPREDAARVAIGRALIHTDLYVVDAAAGLVPVGVPGELWVGGAGVGRGYLHDPRRTAEAFVPRPFAGAPGARLYRTGDRVRRLGEGSLDFLGRFDHQVKLRGHRLELGEIEVALAGHPGLREVAVLAPGRPGRARRLVAYAVPARRERPSLAELRELLGRSLPDYMLPSAVVYLDALPRTATGKVDRKALPEPEGLLDGPSTEYRAPRTHTEVWIAELWRELLGVERIGIHDDFFALGGHSLLAAQVASRVRRHAGVELPLRSVFEAPTVAGLARRLEQASGRAATAELPPLERIARDEELPLSFGEERLWFLDQLHPASPVYVVPAALRLEGPLDAGALDRSLAQIVRRHEALRTGFPETRGRPRRVVLADARVTLSWVDLQAIPTGRREAEALRLARAEGRRPFDLARPPLVRFRLLRLDARSHVALLTLHHIVSDGWSMAVFLRELSVLYRAFLEARPSPLPELDVQLTDYAAWLRGLARAGLFEEQLAFWRERLGSEPPVLELPRDRPDATANPSRGGTLSSPVPAETAERLLALGRRHGATPFMTFLAVFHLLLHRYTGEREVVLGSPTAGRGRVETEPLIGQLINTLVLRLRLSPGSSVLDHLLAVRATSLDAFAHEDLPFEILVEELRPDRRGLENPLFQVMFDLQDVTLDVTLPGLDLSILKLSYGVAKFDLTVYVEREGNDFRVFFEYAADLFDATTIERMARHYVALLGAAIADPGRAAASLPLLSAAERQLLLLEWNAGSPLPGAETRLEELFETHAQRTPEAPALVVDGRCLSYRQVDAWASDVADRLRDVGVRSGSLVLVATDRSAALAVGPLAALKAGAAFVPLDPATPRSRLEGIVADVRPAAALVVDGLRDRLSPVLGDVPIVAFEPHGLLPAGSSVPRSARSGPGAAALAYVIFTSGSTGRPKGVMVPHRAIVAHSRHVVRSFDLRPADRALQFFSPAFDAVLEEVFGSWAAGAAIVLRPESLFSSFEDFAGFLESHGVTVVNLPASYWHDWTRDLVRRDAAVPACVGLLVTGIETVSKERLAEWRRLAGPHVRWLNAYGPTEVAVGALTFAPGAEWSAAGVRSVPIGRPNDETRAYLLDRGLDLLPPGALGEVFLGGTGVAWGYLRRPAATAAAFLPDPFAPEPGAVMYRTGDRARRLPDGTLEFVGRSDRQVKVRGHRVELGEIEAVLEEHPAVRRAAVVVSRASAEDLVARQAAAFDDPEGLAAWLLVAAGRDAGLLLDDVARLSDDDVRRELGGLADGPEPRDPPEAAGAPGADSMTLVRAVS